MADAPMKPVEAWAHVRKDTGEVTFVCDTTEGRLCAEARLCSYERLVRVVITEKDAPR